MPGQPNQPEFFCITMPRVRGRPLKDCIESPQSKIALYIARQLADALLYMHEREICHGDIWADNIMVSDTWDVTLIDLGCAKTFGSRKVTELTRRKINLTYAAPEALDGYPLMPPQDCWPVGLVLTEVATGTTVIEIIGDDSEVKPGMRFHVSLVQRLEQLWPGLGKLLEGSDEKRLSMRQMRDLLGPETRQYVRVADSPETQAASPYPPNSPGDQTAMKSASPDRKRRLRPCYAPARLQAVPAVRATAVKVAPPSFPAKSISPSHPGDIQLNNCNLAKMSVDSKCKAKLSHAANGSVAYRCPSCSQELPSLQLAVAHCQRVKDSHSSKDLGVNDADKRYSSKNQAVNGGNKCYRCPTCSHELPSFELAVAHCQRLPETNPGTSMSSDSGYTTPATSFATRRVSQHVRQFSQSKEQQSQASMKNSCQMYRERNSQTGTAQTVVREEDGSLSSFGEQTIQSLLTSDNHEILAFLVELSVPGLHALTHELMQRLSNGVEGKRYPTDDPESLRRLIYNTLQDLKTKKQEPSLASHSAKESGQSRVRSPIPQKHEIRSELRARSPIPQKQEIRSELRAQSPIPRKQVVRSELRAQSPIPQTQEIRSQRIFHQTHSFTETSQPNRSHEREPLPWQTSFRTERNDPNRLHERHQSFRERHQSDYTDLMMPKGRELEGVWEPATRIVDASGSVLIGGGQCSPRQLSHKLRRRSF